jgi:hypothetical protein
MRIADRDQPILGQHRQRERALHLCNRLDDRVFDVVRFRTGVKMQDDFSVAVRLEDRSLSHQFVAQLARVHQISVVADRDLAVRAVDQNRLCVRQFALTGG